MKFEKPFFRREPVRGRKLFAPSKPILFEFGRAIWFGIAFISGAVVANLLQDPDWSDKRGFWSLLPIACVHIILAGFYFRRIRHWDRWLIAALAVYVLVCFIGMTWKIWMS